MYYTGGDVEGSSYQQGPPVMMGERGSVSASEDEELYMMCLCEKRVQDKGKKKDKNVVIGFLVSI